jgi:hypothetical protein
MPVVESRFHLNPARDIPREFHLIRQRQDMIVASYIYVKHMELVFLAQIIS